MRDVLLQMRSVVAAGATCAPIILIFCLEASVSRDIIDTVTLTPLLKLYQKNYSFVRHSCRKALLYTRDIGDALLRMKSVAAAGAPDALTILRFYLKASWA